METMKKYKLSDWMKTQTNNSFSDESGCITDAMDEEQDNLPYGGDVGITCKYNNSSDNFNYCTRTKDISGTSNLACSEDNKSIKATARYDTHPQPEEFSSHCRDPVGTRISVEMPGSEASFKEELPVGSFSKPGSKEHLTNSKMSDVLLRHFSKGELISTCQLIECETIPEVSFTESINDTVNKPEPSEHVKGPLAHEEWTTNCEEYRLEKHEEVITGDINQSLLNENRCVSNKPIPSTDKCGCRQENSQLINESEDTHILKNMKEESALFKKSVSPHALKYGQGQAHYCLADFSKVASEVKVPERSDNITSVPTTETTRSSPILPSTSVIEKNILDNKSYFNSAEAENQEVSILELLQQLEVEDFSKHATQETFLLQDNYLALSQLKGYLDTLERNYLTAREEHRNLQLQNYKDKSINIGVFDPERKVEMEIFRLGMLLEDIQEQTDDSKWNLSSSLTSCESSHSSYPLCESSVVSSTADPPERRDIETAFLHKNEVEKSQTTDVIPQTNQFSLEGNKCNLCLHMLQKRAESTSRRATEPLGKRGLLANKHSSNVMRFLFPEEKYAAEGLSSHSQGTLSQKFNADEESMKGNTNIQERKTGTRSLFIQKKPTDLSDTNLTQHKTLRIKRRPKRTPSKIHFGHLRDRPRGNRQAATEFPDRCSNSEDISAYDSYNDSQSEEPVNCETERYKTFNTRLCGERKGLSCRYPRESRGQFKVRNYKDSVQPCALYRNKSSGSPSYSKKRISTQKAHKNKEPRELVNRLSERQNSEAAKTCYSSTYDKIILSHQYLPSKKPARSKSAINIRNRNASDSNVNILSFTLDHAIQTANSLKKATERMVRAVSEDLAKVKRKHL
ncbi:protein AKNAD1 isoform X7 [Phalacrocorax aristotelis]|uniref:protein AKNAD1 isoform X7 n=1 Tax=Phalacrocorax aristotelis TaxID=126867 RepID=UPI003F4BD85A